MTLSPAFVAPLRVHTPRAAPALLPVEAGVARYAVFGLAALCLASGVARAEVALQDWIPDVLSLPADAEVVTNREIGSTVRMFSVTTDEDTGPLLVTWEEALRTNGYDIEQDTDELLEDAIEFSGPGIANAKIVASRSADDGETLIEFDATLD